MVPERVRQATALPILSHRGPEFRRMLGDTTDMLRSIIGTQDDIFFLGTSGTGGMETALANVLSPGDAILVIVCGQFGERFVSIAQGMGVTVDQAVVPWGEVPDAASVAERVKARKYRAVVCVHNETRPASSPTLPLSANWCRERTPSLSSTQSAALAGLKFVWMTGASIFWLPLRKRL